MKGGAGSCHAAVENRGDKSLKSYSRLLRPRESRYWTRDKLSIRQVVLSGCSGGGKSTLLAELNRRGFAGVIEPGRRIVEDELRDDGHGLPWVDLAAFAKRAIHLAAEDRRRMSGEAGWVFFDRGLVDAAVSLEHATRQSSAEFAGVTCPLPRESFSDAPLAIDLCDR